MGDLVPFVAIVGLGVAASIAVGMIVATRLDRIMNPAQRPDPDADAGPPATEEQS